MIDQEIVTLISNVGFPIAITLYLLIRMEKVIKENTRVIREMCIKMESMI